MYNSEAITSRDNARLKFVRRVRDGKETGHMFIEGVRLSGEALSSSLRIVSCFVSEAFRRSSSFDAIGSKLRSRQIVFVLSESLLDSISETKTPQGIVLVAERQDPLQPRALFSNVDTNLTLPIWIFLHEINNPSNLGAVVRTAEAAGARGILVSPRSADPCSPKALRASMGSAFRLPIVSGFPLEDVLSTTKEEGIRVAAIDASGRSSYLDVDWQTPRLLIFGSEAEGLPKSILSLAEETIRIPMDGNVESLNLAVSSGVILFEAKRQNEA